MANSIKNDHGVLHTIYELNTAVHAPDSHAGRTDNSFLEVDYRNSYRIENSELLSEGYLWYPRIKRLSGGKYLLFFQDGRWGPNVYCSHSEDGKSWGKPSVLFAAHPTCEGKFIRHYATCDALELANGDIVIGAIFHAVKKDAESPNPDRFLMTEKGIVTKYSTDGGHSWSEQQTVYHGRVWEPSFLQLPDGTVQMYLTHSAPKDAIYREKMGGHVSSGVAMLTSRDNGRTWDPKPLTYPYIATRIAQQKIYVNENGVQILTDQMPVAVLLHDNKTIAMCVESQRADRKGHKTSIIRSHDFFSTVLEENAEGPEDRDSNVHSGTGPYIAQFPSGEVALSMADNARMRIFIGNEKATKFNFDNPCDPHVKTSRALWGDLFVTDGHVLTASFADIIVEPGVHSNLRTNGLGITKMILNHDIEAKKADITVDGDTADWCDSTEALFVGSISQAQCSLRAAHDDERVYFLIEQLDEDICTGEIIELFVSDGKNTFRLDAGLGGVTSALRIGGEEEITVDSAVKLYGTVDNSEDKDEGFVTELSVPKKHFEGSDLRVFVKMYNVDAEKAYSWDGFNGPKEGDVSTWPTVHLV